MSEDATPPTGPDLRAGIPLQALKDGEPVFGHVEDAPVFLIRQGEDVAAFNAKCTHYGGPLGDGVVEGRTLRCPWHHACFSLEDGQVLGGPAFNPLARWSVSVRDGKVTVGERQHRDPLEPRGRPAREPDAVVIIGAGAAGSSAAETLRVEGYGNPIVLLDPEPEAPYDRPNLSKDYLAGEAPEDWMPLRSKDFFSAHGIQRLNTRAVKLDVKNHLVHVEEGESIPFGVALLAPGSIPRRLPVPGEGRRHVHYLRSLDDCRRIILASERAQRVAVVGASFIGMEVAASLRHRGLPVTVIAPEEVPFRRTLGPELGRFVQSLHEEEGVEFRLGSTVKGIDDGLVLLERGAPVEADMVVIGVGVRPDLTLAQDAGLDVDDGIVVDELLRTSHPDVYAAGDVALYPEPRLGHRVRIEHWVVARRQGRTVARNILGREEPFTDAPFFWTEHFGIPIAYVGHAEDWDEATMEGDCGDEGCAVVFKKGGRRRALATVFRDRDSLLAEVAMEKEARGTVSDS